jgi:hypothetical protein
MPPSGSRTGLRYNLGGTILSRLVDLPTFLVILPKPRMNRFWRGGTGLPATLRNTGAPDEQNTKDWPELVSTCFARRGRIRCPHIPMSTPGMPRGIRPLTLISHWRSVDRFRRGSKRH